MSTEALISVPVNGEERRFPIDVTVAEVIEQSVHSKRGCAVALNGAVVPRSTWHLATVHDGDRIEIISPAQGG